MKRDIKDFVSQTLHSEKIIWISRYQNANLFVMVPIQKNPKSADIMCSYSILQAY
jgi:hypothetical protein